VRLQLVTAGNSNNVDDGKTNVLKSKAVI